MNTYSDIPWEVIAPFLFELFPSVEFYDYTKELDRLDNLPSNYYLAISHHEKSDTEFELEYIRNGGTVVAVVPVSNYSRTNRTLPKTWNGVPIQDGDKNDLLFLDKGKGGTLRALKMKAGLSKEFAAKGSFVLNSDLEW